jgi:iron complex transport system substrate-binding protein
LKKFYFIILMLLLFINIKIMPTDKRQPNDIRIVSLAPAITKDLFCLGLDDNIVGVTDYCVYEDKIDNLVKKGQIKRVSSYSNFNYELILSVNPTHILCMDSTTIEQFNMLKKISGCKIISFEHPKNIDEIKKQISEIGSLFGKEEKSRELVNGINKSIGEIEKNISKIAFSKRPKVLVEIYYPPFMTCGKNTFISDIILKAGGRLCIDIEKDWPQLTVEDILKAGPDVILKGHLAETDNSLLIIDAYKKKHVFYPKNIDDFLQPGIQNIDAIKELNEYLDKNFFR